LAHVAFLRLKIPIGATSKLGGETIADPKIRRLIDELVENTEKDVVKIVKIKTKKLLRTPLRKKIKKFFKRK